MFSSKDLKVKLVYMGFGGMIAIIGMLFGIGMLSPVTAQRDKFGDIECASLTVVDKTGRLSVVIGNAERGGTVGVFGKDGKSGVNLRVSEHGGNVVSYDKDGEPGVGLGIDEHGGRASIYGKDAHLGVFLSAAEHGGRVSTYGKDGKIGVLLGVSENGGYFQANGKGKGSVTIGINEYGNGAVSTWDKNGYRQ